MADDQDDPPLLDHPAPAWFHAYLKDLNKWLKDHRPVSGLNCMLSDTPGGGKRIDVGMVPATIISPFPFQTIVADGKFKTAHGTINALVPTGCGNFKSFHDGDAVILNVRTNGRQVVSAAIITGTLPSPPDCTAGAPPTLFQFPIAIVSKTSVYQITFNNLACFRSLCHREPKPYPIIPTGSSPWSDWWTWTIVPEMGPQAFPV